VVALDRLQRNLVPAWVTHVRAGGHPEAPLERARERLPQVVAALERKVDEPQLRPRRKRARSEVAPGDSRCDAESTGGTYTGRCGVS
jgi:hypothetical protein